MTDTIVTVTDTHFDNLYLICDAKIFKSSNFIQKLLQHVIHIRGLAKYITRFNLSFSLDRNTSTTSRI